MRAVVQRVSQARVLVGSNVVASIGHGITALIGFHKDDSDKDMEYIAGKLPDLRIFTDSNDTMNYSLRDTDGELLIASQFTLYGDARKGRRPSYADAMPPDIALQFYNRFVELCRMKYPKVKTGVFGAMMEIDLVNSGPVTILLDSSRIL